MGLRDQGQNMSRLVWKMLLEPFLEQPLQFERQTQHCIPSGGRSARPRSLENPLHLTVVEGRDHWCAEHSGWDPGTGKRRDRFKATFRCWRAWFHTAGEHAVERRYRYRYSRQLVPRHVGENVDVTLDQRRFADNRDGVTKFTQHFEDRPRDAKTAFDRLIRIGIAAQRQRLAGVSFFSQLGGEQGCCLRLVKETALKIEAG